MGEDGNGVDKWTKWGRLIQVWSGILAGAAVAGYFAVSYIKENRRIAEQNKEQIEILKKHHGSEIYE